MSYVRVVVKRDKGPNPVLHVNPAYVKWVAEGGDSAYLYFKDGRNLRVEGPAVELARALAQAGGE